ncbi:hypothetical protein P700755_004043 [Psychroflexus torquis ATCC 700755]|uniref:Uncharacterized protein n=1 Tax=Psychroflexus torquis (strain ATCC 700755 / CIP 106069 / ACAM 623) TaxID=313595 RepID=K4ILD7_PSYTT|nr:hypothetical protein [Psychroflexus torquis]AFU70593.1 hypothetical protein P700755_004043 [Psychroflexus torquis ATCC 700755]
MIKFLTLPLLMIFSFLTFGNLTELNTLNVSEYEKNLNTASELYLKENKIPDSILIKLVPENYTEFELYCGTTGPDHNLGKTDFFYETTRLIFEQVTSEKNSDFYLPSLKLISFADGEYAEDFVTYLEIIIKMDKAKFCKSINGKEYIKRNPIKFYSELNKCE